VQSYDQPAFTTYDAALGIAKDAWHVQLYGQNVTDARYVTFIDDGLLVKSEFIGRPRTVGLRFGYNF
jgi:outer membrane receptor protein involved in Fe transport